ncbi:MAG: DUF1566 domain-containing protein [Candidatus Omnitrophica bacterium]|nr:DUF1566 domain-containing protein [Candidatus Omnitrophota bacterium]
MRIITSAMILSIFLFASDALSFADSVKLKAIVPKTSSYGVPKTGQTSSYASRDDGYYKKGTPLSGSQYTYNTTNKTAIDNGTGLMWQTYANTSLKWASAIAYAATVNSNGSTPYADWRLPNIKELQSIINYSNRMPLDAGSGYFNCNGKFWSSTTYDYSTTQAWYVDHGFTSGEGKTDHGSKNLVCYVRLVRGPD